MARPWRRGERGHSDKGSVTVEFALGLPSLIVILAFALSGAAWALDLQSAQRGAGEAARAAVVDSSALAVSIGQHVSGQADVSVTRSDGFVTACVRVNRAPWPVTTRCSAARDRP